MGSALGGRFNSGVELPLWMRPLGVQAPNLMSNTYGHGYSFEASRYLRGLSHRVFLLGVRDV
jgi:hypothetical protein